MPCVIKIGKDAWTIQDYDHGNRLAQGIMLATAPGWEGNESKKRSKKESGTPFDLVSRQQA